MSWEKELLRLPGLNPRTEIVQTGLTVQKKEHPSEAVWSELYTMDVLGAWPRAPSSPQWAPQLSSWAAVLSLLFFRVKGRYIKPSLIYKLEIHGAASISHEWSVASALWAESGCFFSLFVTVAIIDGFRPQPSGWWTSVCLLIFYPYFSARGLKICPGANIVC